MKLKKYLSILSLYVMLFIMAVVISGINAKEEQLLKEQQEGTNMNVVVYKN